MDLRPFSDAFLDHYLAAAGPDVLGCVGAYQLEGLGAQLMAGSRATHSTMLGLPLLPLLQFLRDQGVLRDVIVLGLTGSIAMGKSRAAERFRAFGVPVFDSDAQVHALFAPGGAAVAAVARRSRAALGAGGGIDRERARPHGLGRPDALRRLEAIVHPLVRAGQDRFLRRACRAAAELVVLDVPLLFETGGDRRVDAVAVVCGQRHAAGPARAAPAGHDRREAGAHPRRSSCRTLVKRRRADFVIPSGS